MNKRTLGLTYLALALLNTLVAVTSDNNITYCVLFAVIFFPIGLFLVLESMDDTTRNGQG